MAFRPSRRWLRFSLRTLLVLVTCFCVWLGWQVRIVHRRKAVLDDIRAADGRVLNWEESGDFGPPPFKALTLPFWRYWMGDEDIGAIGIQELHALKLGVSTVDEIQGRFPEAEIMVFEQSPPNGAIVGYSNWRDEQLGLPLNDGSDERR